MANDWLWLFSINKRSELEREHFPNDGSDPWCLAGALCPRIDGFTNKAHGCEPPISNRYGEAALSTTKGRGARTQALYPGLCIHLANDWLWLFSINKRSELEREHFPIAGSDPWCLAGALCPEYDGFTNKAHGCEPPFSNRYGEAALSTTKGRGARTKGLLSAFRIHLGQATGCKGCVPRINEGKSESLYTNVTIIYTIRVRNKWPL